MTKLKYLGPVTLFTAKEAETGEDGKVTAEAIQVTLKPRQIYTGFDETNKRVSGLKAKSLLVEPDKDDKTKVVPLVPENEDTTDTPPPISKEKAPAKKPAAAKQKEA